MSHPVTDTRCALLTTVGINVHPGFYGPALRHSSLFIIDTVTGKSEDSPHTHPHGLRRVYAVEVA